MILYHGADKEIKKPSIPLSEIGREFGIGFYVTDDRALAENQAKKKTKQAFFYDNPKPTITAFQFEEAEANPLKLKRLNGYSEEWLDFVFQCYTDIHFVHSYDIVIGNAVLPEVAELLTAYRSGSLTKANLLEKLQAQGSALQICFSTAVALEYLTPITE